MPTATYDQLLNFADLAGNGIAMGAQNGKIVSNDYTNQMQRTSGSVGIPTDRWVCIELAIPSGMSGATRVSIDGTEVSDVMQMKAAVQPAPDHAYFGIDWVDNLASLPTIDAWYDDVIIDDKPIGCAL